MIHELVETGSNGGVWCVFDGNGPPNSGHLSTTNRELADHVCRLLNAILQSSEARKAVTDWMDAEGLAGRMRLNREAPGWRSYLEIEGELSRLVLITPKFLAKSNPEVT